MVIGWLKESVYLLEELARSTSHDQIVANIYN